MKDSHKGKELVKNTGILAIGNICTKAVAFLLLPLYTAVLSTEEYGTIDLLTTYVTLLVPIVNIQLSQAIFRFATEKRKEIQEVTYIFSSVYMASFVLIVVFGVLFFSASPFITLPYKWYLFIGTLLQILLQVISYSARAIGDNLTYSIGNFISGSTIILFNVIFLVVFNMGIGGMVISYCVGPVLGSIYMGIKIQIWKYWSYEYIRIYRIKEYIKYSLPLVPNQLSWWVLTVSNRVIITSILGLSANGIIAVATRMSSIYGTIFTIFHSSWTEQVVLHYHDDDGISFIQNMIDSAVRFFVALNLGIIVCIPFIFPFAIHDSFGASYNQILLFLISGLGNLVIGLIEPIYIVHNETKKIASAAVMAAGINIVADFALVHFIGIYAAAVSTILGYLVVIILRVRDIERRYFSIGISNKLLVAILGMYGITSGMYIMNNFYINILNFFIVGAFCIIINRFLLRKSLRLIKKRF